MNQLITLLLSSSLLLILISSSVNALPPNAHTAGNGWKCNTGYKRQGQQCNKIFIPQNAVFRGQGWICKPGFKRIGQQCNRQTRKTVTASPLTAKPTSGVNIHNQSKQIDLAIALSLRGEYAGALKIFQPLANQGNASAQLHLGTSYRLGWGVLTDKKRALNWYRKAALQGDSYAQVYLGDMYQRGEGVKQDDKQAYFWRLKAANQGFAEGQYEIGVMHGDGRGVLKDYKKQIYWFRKAADQGYEKAQMDLAIHYALGEGVLQSDRKAVQWFRKLVINQDLGLAQSSLGQMYCDGIMVPRNLHKCAIWMKKSHENGYVNASKTWDKYELWKYQ